MLKKLIVSDIPASILPVSQELNFSPANEQVEHFDTTRFYHWQPTPEIAIIGGSSYSSMQAAQATKKDNSTILDACAYAYTVDIDSGTYRIAIAISDGQGHSPEEKENAATAQTAQYNCEQLVASPELPSAETYHHINAMSHDAYFQYQHQQIPFSYDPFNRPSATLSGALLMHHADHHGWQLHLSSTGDSLTVLINGQTGEVIFSSAARMFERAKQVWSPKGVQQLNNDSGSVEIHTMAVQEGDWLIQMTDGFWGELSGTTKTEEVDERGRTNTEERFQELNLGTPLSAISHPSDLAKAVQYRSLANSIEKRLCYLSLLTDPEYKNATLPIFASRQEDEAYTLQRWIDDNHCSDKLKQKIQNIDALQSHDGARLQGDAHQIPASQHIHHWESMAFGDCSTLQVMRIPHYTHCILREWFEQEHERWLNVAQRSAPSSTTDDWLDANIQAVLQQDCIPNQIQGLRWHELAKARRVLFSDLRGLNAETLIRALQPHDLPYVKAMVLAGKTPQEQIQRWQTFSHFLTEQEAAYAAQPTRSIFRKTANPVKAMRKAVLNHLLEGPPASLEEALNWPFFTEKEKGLIAQRLRPTCNIH